MVLAHLDLNMALMRAVLYQSCVADLDIRGCREVFISVTA
jgi:hypothetical protein